VLGVGILGLSADGGWAAQAHAPAIRALESVALRAVCNSTAASSAAAADDYGIGYASGPRELADRDDVDLVVVAVKAPRHAQLVEAALAAGKPVLCEWPLGVSLGQSQSLAAASAASAPGFVGLQSRAAPTIRYLRDLVKDGYVGRVLSTSMIASGRAWGESFKARQAYTLDSSQGSSMLAIPLGHTLDAVEMVLGEFRQVAAVIANLRPQVREVESGELHTKSTEDQVAIIGQLADEAVASIHFRGGTARRTNFYWEICGTDGELIVEGDTGHLQIANLRVFGARGGSSVEPLNTPARYQRVPALAGRAADPAYNVAHAYLDIVDDLHGEGPLAPRFAHAAQRKVLLAAIEQSATSGVAVDLSGPRSTDGSHVSGRAETSPDRT
jgi:predicted dehydrogenase